MKGCLRIPGHLILPEKGLDNPQEGEDVGGSSPSGERRKKTSGEGECFAFQRQGRMARP